MLMIASILHTLTVLWFQAMFVSSVKTVSPGMSAVIGRVSFRFTGAVTDTCLMEEMPGKRATSAVAEVAKEGTKCVEVGTFI